MIKQIGSFVGKDASGKAYTILLLQPYKRMGGTLTESDEWVPITKRLRTPAGESVSPRGNGHYQLITRTGELVDLTSDDPNAV